jgi:hypothetical protein
VLTRSDFAITPKAATRPTDKVDKATWSGIVTLPDDVAIRTSNNHGSTLRQMYDLWGAWIESIGEIQDSLYPAMLGAGDDFQSATYAALTGFYRLSVSALRSALETTAIATWAQVTRNGAEYRAWRKGKSSLSFGKACDGLISPTKKLGKYLRAKVNDNLFDQRTPATEGGFARRIHDGLSNFAHSRPGYTEWDFRRSNGPIYVGSVFKHVSWIQSETLGLCFVLFLIARPGATLPRDAVELFKDVKRVRSKVTRAAYKSIYQLSPAE